MRACPSPDQTGPLQGSFLEATPSPVETVCLLPWDFPGEVTPFMKTLRAICFQGSGPTQAGSPDTHGRICLPRCVKGRPTSACRADLPGPLPVQADFPEALLAEPAEFPSHCLAHEEAGGAAAPSLWRRTARLTSLHLCSLHTVLSLRLDPPCLWGREADPDPSFGGGWGPP